MRKPIIGLSGGIGAGKSEAARILADLGAVVIDSDAISRQALDSEEVIGILRTWWGSAVVRADGRADRRRIADIVFADEAQRQRLERVLHPRVAAERKRRIETAERDPGARAIVIDSPLLYEAGLNSMCDCVIFVNASREVCQARLTSTRGWTPEELTRREKSQQNVEQKSRRADYTVDNNSSREALRETIQGIFSQILSGANTGDASR